MSSGRRPAEKSLRKAYGPCWLPELPLYQSLFILVFRPPGSGHTPSAILEEMATSAPVDESAVVMSLARLDGAATRRRELGAFIRSRRERLKPQQVGLNASRRRRTPGLRREEVAQLAGVGVTWYTWLEQGRDIRPSVQVLDAIARALQFDQHEHAHLFTLAGVAASTIAEECMALCPTVPPLLDQLEPYPAAVVNARWDLLGYNGVYASFFDGLDSIPIENRNLLWLAFTERRWRRVMVEWDEVVERMVAEYRAALAKHLDDPTWKALVARLHAASAEFTVFWDRHDVQSTEGRTYRVRHPQAGILRLAHTDLWLGERHGTRIIAFTPADNRTRTKLEELSGMLGRESGAPARALS
jgi:transcriptional regulator with XRE-family HTH domain